MNDKKTAYQAYQILKREIGELDWTWHSHQCHEIVDEIINKQCYLRAATTDRFSVNVENSSTGGVHIDIFTYGDDRELEEFHFELSDSDFDRLKHNLVKNARIWHGKGRKEKRKIFQDRGYEIVIKTNYV